MDKLTAEINFIKIALGSFVDYKDPVQRENYLLSELSLISDETLRKQLKGYVEWSKEELKELLKEQTELLKEQQRKETSQTELLKEQTELLKEQQRKETSQTELLKEQLREKNLLQEKELKLIASTADSRYEVFVTHWNSGIMKSVPFSPSLPLSRFLISCGFSFQLSCTSKRLYYLHPKAKWEEKVRISDSKQLKDIVDQPEEENEQYFYTIYLFTGDNSPDSSPKKLFAEGEEPKDKEEAKDKGESKSESSSSNSKGRRGSYQTRFRSDILKRDADICRTCSEKNCGEAAHVIDVEWNIPDEILMKEFSIMSIYDPRNGIILCKNCHWDYDHFILGIDPEGNIFSTHSESTRTFKNTIYLSPTEKKEKKLLLPTKKILKFKFQRFLDHNEENEDAEPQRKNTKSQKKSFYGLFAGMSLTPQKKK